MSADPFTAASPTYRNAMRLRSRTGPAFEVTGGRPWPTPLALLFTVLAAAALWVAALALFIPALAMLDAVRFG